MTHPHELHDGRPVWGPHATRTIRVGAVPGGWRVDSVVCGQAMMFLSGACAERQARALAARLAAAGYDAVVEIRGRDGRLAGRIRYGACGEADLLNHPPKARRTTRH